MNKVKMFFIAAALLLTTAGVFAGKAKFANYELYAFDDTSTYKPLTGQVIPSFSNITLAGGAPISFVSSTNLGTYYLYASNTSGVYSAIYTTF